MSPSVLLFYSGYGIARKSLKLVRARRWPKSGLRGFQKQTLFSIRVHVDLSLCNMDSVLQQRLNTVLGKALDVSGASLGEEELAECFGSIKTQYGTRMDRLFNNMLDKMRSNIESGYKDICIRRELDERLLDLENLEVEAPGGVELEFADPVLASVEQVKRMEINHLENAMREIDMEMKRLNERAAKIKQGVLQEVQNAKDLQASFSV